MLQIFIEWDPLRPRKVCKTASKKSSISLARSQHSCSASTRRPTRCVLSSFLSHHSTTGKKSVVYIPYANFHDGSTAMLPAGRDPAFDSRGERRQSPSSPAPSVNTGGDDEACTLFLHHELDELVVCRGPVSHLPFLKAEVEIEGTYSRFCHRRPGQPRGSSRRPPRRSASRRWRS